MERFAINKLKEWKDKENRVPIILCGARGVGKSWILHEFGARFFDSVVYIDFEKNQELKSIFKRSLNVTNMIMALEMASGERVSFSRSLIVLDEIEDVVDVMKALDSFKENIPELAIVCSISKSKSYVDDMMIKSGVQCDVLTVYPLSLEEFSLAIGEDEQEDVLYKYCLVGGIPQIVLEYINGQSINDIYKIQQDNVNLLKDKANKTFTKPAAKKIIQILDSLCTQLSKDNKKFMYGQIKKGARAKEYENAVKWLEDNGYIYRVYRALDPSKGLLETVDTSAFKIFFYDMGLFIALSNDFTEYRNSVKELLNAGCYAVAEEYSLIQFIMQTDFIPYYYSAEYSKGEISFLFNGKDSIVPVDVMGTENLQAKSLKAFKQKYNTKDAVRLSLSNDEERSWMRNVQLKNVKMVADMLDKSSKIMLNEIKEEIDNNRESIEEIPSIDMTDYIDNVTFDDSINLKDTDNQLNNASITVNSSIDDLDDDDDLEIIEEITVYQVELESGLGTKTKADPNYQVDLETMVEFEPVSEGKQGERKEETKEELKEESNKETKMIESNATFDLFDSDDLDFDDFEIEESSVTIISEEDTESFDFEEPLELGLELDAGVDFGSSSDFTSIYTQSDYYTPSYLEDSIAIQESSNKAGEVIVESIEEQNTKVELKNANDDADDDFAEYVWTEDMIKKYT